MNDYNLKLEKYLIPLISKFKKPNMLEFGVRAGISTKKFLNICKKNKGHLYSVDTTNYAKLFKDSRWTFLNCRDDNFNLIKKRIPQKIDVIYIDSLHEAKHVEKLIFYYFNYLKLNGYMFIDDVSHLPYLKNKPRNSFYCEINNQETYEVIMNIYNDNSEFFDLTFHLLSSGICVIKKIKNKKLIKQKKIKTRKYSFHNLARLTWKIIKSS
jgi:predicted O-methyltransferase YrrM